VRVIAYTKAAAALFRRGRLSFSVTPKGAATRSVWRSTLKWQICLAVIAVSAVAYQVAAQIFDLPAKLTVFAFAVTVFWSLINAGLLGATVWWARSIRHRRQAHRFPVWVEAAYCDEADGPPTAPRPCMTSIPTAWQCTRLTI
jgi:uncharacterized integral membrane protein